MIHTPGTGSQPSVPGEVMMGRLVSISRRTASLHSAPTCSASRQAPDGTPNQARRRFSGPPGTCLEGGLDSFLKRKEYNTNTNTHTHTKKKQHFKQHNYSTVLLIDIKKHGRCIQKVEMTSVIKWIAEMKAFFHDSLAIAKPPRCSLTFS